jgi:regulator of protease activity HflC (stomatin/prohibitin superfamily)
MFQRLHVKQHERALRFRRGDFVRLLQPGTYRRPLFARLRGITTEVASTLDVAFTHRLLDVLVRHADLKAALHVVDLKDHERALVWKDGRLAWILGAGRHAFWKEPYELRFEVFDVEASARFEHPSLDVVLAHRDASRFLVGVEAAPQEEVILFRDGAPVARFREGRYVYWLAGRKAEIRSVDLREQTADVAGQEIMTRDKVTLRVNLVVTSRVLDALAAVTVVSDWSQALYREAQLALRAAVGARTLDALLVDKETVGGEVRAALAKRAQAFGVEVRSVGLRDLILPGDMKTILNQVITAQKQAEANVIKRREETAAARSQANTAKLLAENPVLARIKELEMLQEILAGARTAFVFGRGDLASQVRTLIDRGPDLPP